MGNVYSGSTLALLFKIVGQDGKERFGWSADATGDIDLDGTPDFVIGSHQTLEEYGFWTSARVFSGATHTLLYFWHGPVGTHLGRNVRGAGDVDNDGHSDVLVHSSLGTSVFPNGGAVNIFSGKSGTNILTVNGPTVGGNFGYRAMIPMGDVNGDGLGDFAASALGFIYPLLPGNVHVVSGANGATIWSIAGTLPDELLGQVLANTSDRDGDGALELLTGSPTTGIATVRSGSTGQLLESIDFGNGVRTARQLFDVDADGTNDWVAGYPSEQSPKGAIRVFSGANHAVIAQTNGENESLGYAIEPLGEFDDQPGSEWLVSGHRHGPQHNGRVILFTRCSDPVSIHGSGCPTAAGIVPMISLLACLKPGGIATLTVSNGAPGAIAFVAIGAGAATIPLNPACSLLIGPVLPSSFFTSFGQDPSGSWTAVVQDRIPLTGQGSFSIQAFIFDPAAPARIAASHAILGNVTP